MCILPTVLRGKFWVVSFNKTGISPIPHFFFPFPVAGRMTGWW